MSDVKQYDPTQVKPEDHIRLTATALQHVRQALKKRGSGIGIRFGIKKSGCSGYAYTVDYVDQTEPHEHVFTISNDVIVCVDPKHWLVLKGTELDYIREGLNHRFQYNNPNETGGCGCGESFTVD